MEVLLTRTIHRAGGQAKRTNIGLALVADPQVLFLDEPTSGLDSFTANEVHDCLQGQLTSHRTYERAW